MPKTRVFLDTNILAYAHDRHDPTRQKKAQSILRTRFEDIVLSTQVLQEFHVTAVKKLGLSPVQSREILQAWTCFETVLITPDRIANAIDIEIAHQLSFWDALIIIAAHAARCPTLYSKDLNHGQIILGVQIENPFLSDKIS